MEYPYDCELLVCAENITCEAGEKFLEALDMMSDEASDENEETLRLARIQFVDFLIASDSIDPENRNDYLLDSDEGSGILDKEIEEVKTFSEPSSDEPEEFQE